MLCWSAAVLLILIFSGLSYPLVKLKERAAEQPSHRLRPRAASLVVSIHEPLLPQLALGLMLRETLACAL